MATSPYVGAGVPMANPGMQLILRNLQTTHDRIAELVDLQRRAVSSAARLKVRLAHSIRQQYRDDLAVEYLPETQVNI